MSLLSQDDGTEIASAVTDSEGYYSFSNFDIMRYYRIKIKADVFVTNSTGFLSKSDISADWVLKKF